MTTVTLGPNGSFSSQAAQLLCPGSNIDFATALPGLQQLKSGRADAAVYPVENNLGGFVKDTFDALYRTKDVFIDAMHTLHITQNLISRAKSVDEIDVIYSHPQAIAQCSRNIARLNETRTTPLRIVTLSSTAAGVLTAAKDPHAAAIGSLKAAQLYGIDVLIESFQDRSRNETRFARFATRPLTQPHDVSVPYRSMYLVEFDNLTEGFHELTSLFYSYQVAITALNHAPVYREEGALRYAFFVEIASAPFLSEQIRGVHKALIERRLSSQSRRARWIGSYPVAMEE